MFQEFPYTNFHQLNLDWIVKIAKDFLDQYTHIQEVIQTGLNDLAESRETGLAELDQKRLDSLAELNQKTLDGLADLQTKYDTLDGLLQAWYDTHSADIADQLADAIADFNMAAETKSQALLDSWPEDYSELVTGYNNLKNAFMLNNIYIEQGSIRADGTNAPSDARIRTGFLEFTENTTITAENGYKFHYQAWNKDFTIHNMSYDWVTSKEITSLQYYWRIIVAKTNDTDEITPDDFENAFPNSFANCKCIMPQIMVNDRLNAQKEYTDNKTLSVSTELKNENKALLETTSLYVEQGTINALDELIDAENRIRTGFFRITENTTITALDGYLFAIKSRQLDGSIVATTSGLTTINLTVKDRYYQLIVYKSGNSVIAPYEFENAITISTNSCAYYIPMYMVNNNITAFNVEKRLFEKCDNIYVEQGTINGSNVYSDSKIRLRTCYFKITEDTIITANTGFSFGIIITNNNGRFSSADFSLTTKELTIKDRFYQLIVYKNDNSVIIPEEFTDAVSFSVSSCLYYAPMSMISAALMKKTDVPNGNKLAGKRLSVLGDSISSYQDWGPYGETHYYYPTGDVNTYTKMYWGLLNAEEGMILDTINGFAGSTVGTKWQPDSVGVRIPFIDADRISGLGTPDVIVVFGGTNDYSGNPLGESFVDDGQYTNLYEFRTAFAYLLDQLKQTYPSAKILCLTIMDKFNTTYNVENLYPIKQKEIRQELAPEGTPTHFMYEFNDSIRAIANRYGCTLVNISDCMNYYNTANECVDGANPDNHTHPKAIVHRRIKEKIKTALLSLY